MRALLFIFFLLNLPVLAYAQCGSLVLDVSDSVCISENLVISNMSAPTTTFEWDFCPESLANPNSDVNLFDITNSVGPFALDYVEIGNELYVFVASRNNSSIQRIKFTNNFGAVPSIQDLGNAGGMLVNPQGIHMFEEGGNWYALVSNNSEDILRLDFGPSIENNSPTATLVSSISGINDIRGLTIEREGSSVYAVLAAGGGTGRVTILDFGNSILNTPIVLANPAAVGNFPTSVSLYRDCDTWYGLVSSFSANSIYLLNYGNSLTNVPATIRLNVILQPQGISLNKDGNQFFGFATNSVNNLIRFEFGESFFDTDYVLTDQGDIGVNNRSSAFQVVKRESVFYYLAAGVNDRRLIIRDFDESCPVSLTHSNEREPTGINYSSEGWQRYEVSGTDANGFVETLIDSVYVRSAPDVNFSVDLNCEGETTVFADQTILDGVNATSWAWDFGDPASGANNTSTLQNPVHQFTAAGDYNVMLQVTDDCGVMADTTITVKIFQANDLQPDFAIPVGECSNQPVQFTDASNTIEDTVVGWFWDFGDPGSGADNTSTLQNPTHIFSTDGDFDITLTITGSSGCQETIVNPGGAPISVFPGPQVNFSFTDECAGETIQFTDLSTGANLSSWLWDFGDGTTSTLQNPAYFYGDPGDYNVSLTVGNSDGCLSSFAQSITIYGIPQVAFSNDLACDAESTQFVDLTTIVNANPVSWSWDFGDGSTSNLQNPLHQFPGPGVYDVKLIVTSNFGCLDSLVQSITVNASPVADFTFNQVCTGETVFFQDLSDAGTGLEISDWLWQINGGIITEQNPSVVFEFPGDYLVELIVSSENLCTSSISRMVTINEAPFVDFSLSNACSEQFTSFQNMSTPGDGDAIISYLWDFDGLGTSNLAEPAFVFPTPGTYRVYLTVETQNGCVGSLFQDIDIGLSPVSDFSPSATLGSPPMEVTLENLSSNADAFSWDFGNGEQSTDPEPTVVYNSIGTYDVQMVSFLGNCTDTLVRTIRVVEAELDVSLDNITLLENNQNVEIQINVTNRGPP